MTKHQDENAETNDFDQPLVGDVTPKRHPIFGWMKGSLTVAEGVDLTEPACPEWPELIEEKMARMERMLGVASKDENERK